MLSGPKCTCLGTKSYPKNVRKLLSQRGRFVENWGSLHIAFRRSKCRNKVALHVKWLMPWELFLIYRQAKRMLSGSKCGGFRLIPRTYGPQTSYQVELMGLRVAAPQRSTITLDNKVVVDRGSQPPHRKALDIDLRQISASVIHQKSIIVRCIPGHR